MSPKAAAVTVTVNVLRDYSAGGHGKGTAGETGKVITQAAYDFLAQHDPSDPIVELVPPPASATTRS